MKTKIVLFPVLAGLALVAVEPCRAGDEQLDAAKTPVARSGKGPVTIDVSQYPSGIRENYEVFSQKCAKCHNLSRPINSNHVLPDEWSHCLGRMKRRPGSNISSSEEKKLYDFLVYDSSVRKRSELEAKLQSLPPQDQREARDKIKEVADRYK